MSRIALHDISPQPDEAAMLLYERRRKIHTRVAPGRFRNLRLGNGLVVTLTYLLTPWLQIDGRQAVLIDLPARQFHIFWFSFQPQDLILLSAVLMILAFALFLATTLRGRVWCGYSCPQTLWSFAFMWVERKIEGERNQRIRLDATATAPLSGGRTRSGWRKLAKRSAKHLLWLVMALITGATFIAYFYGASNLLHDALRWQIPLIAVAWIIFFTLATYINAGWLREHVCIYICPYARFQSVMYDSNTLTVSYDTARGEPRAARRRDSRHDALGACIDCQLCVQVCPTGIDIRDGLQYQCIACAACIDACDAVMDKMQYARGLIAYRALEPRQGKQDRLRPKAMIYGAVLLAMVTLFSLLLLGREPLRLEVSRDRGELYQLLGSNRVQNIYELQLRNASADTLVLSLAVCGLPDARLLPDQPITLAAGESLSMPLRVQVDTSGMAAGNIPISFIVRSNNNDIIQRRESRFISPITR